VAPQPIRSATHVSASRDALAEQRQGHGEDRQGNEFVHRAVAGGAVDEPARHQRRRELDGDRGAEDAGQRSTCRR
jgi:hypothetical protein